MKIENFQLCFIICLDTTKHSHVFFLIGNYNAMTSEVRAKDNLRQKNCTSNHMFNGENWDKLPKITR